MEIMKKTESILLLILRDMRRCWVLFIAGVY